MTPSTPRQRNGLCPFLFRSYAIFLCQHGIVDLQIVMCSLFLYNSSRTAKKETKFLDKRVSM